MRPRDLLLVALVAAAAVPDLVVGLRGHEDPVPAEAMEAGGARLRALARPSDVLVVSPLFSVRELAALGDLRVRPDVPAAHIRRLRRVLVLDRTDHRIFGLGAASEVERLGGRLELRIYEPAGGGEAPIWELATALEVGTMSVERPIGQVSSRCTRARREGGFECPGEAEWLYAAPRSLRIDGADAECVWAHPTTGGAIVFTVPAQPAPGEGRHLELEVSAGLADDAVRGTPDGAPVETQLVQGGAPIGRVRVPNAVGWQKTRVKIAADLPVELRITTPRDGRRHHCVNARVLEVAAP